MIRRLKEPPARVAYRAFNYAGCAPEKDQKEKEEQRQKARCRLSGPTASYVET